MQYYGTRLSENISKREPEGYLLCLNVPVARTGTQEYLPEELGLPAGGGMVTVHRLPGEVFSPETVASFEGMPVTNDHPPDGVDAENIRRLQRGHAHNVRRGAGKEADLLLADLILTDPCLIDAVLAGKREISCGYTYELHEENGRYLQRKIRGNHIAVVDAGRAGPRVSIRDTRPRLSGSNEGSPFDSNTDQTERRKATMKKSLSRVLARMAKDGDTETVAEFIGEILGENAGESAKEEPVTVEVPEEREITIDSETLTGILRRLEELTALLTAALNPPETGEDEDPEEEVAEIVEEVLEAAGTEAPAPEEVIAGIVEEVLEPEGSAAPEEIPGDEECRPDPKEAADVLRAAIRTFRPVLKRMTPGERRKACADIAAGLRRTRGATDGKIYAALASARRPAPDLAGLGQRIMASRNANYRK